MSKQNAEQFLEEIHQNQNLNEQLNSAIDIDVEQGAQLQEKSDKIIEKVVAFAQDNGFDFNAADYRSALSEQYSETNKELSDADLEQVAGGNMMWNEHQNKPITSKQKAINKAVNLGLSGDDIGKYLKIHPCKEGS